METIDMTARELDALYMRVEHLPNRADFDDVRIALGAAMRKVMKSAVWIVDPDSLVSVEATPFTAQRILDFKEMRRG